VSDVREQLLPWGLGPGIALFALGGFGLGSHRLAAGPTASPEAALAAGYLLCAAALAGAWVFMRRGRLDAASRLALVVWTGQAVFTGWLGDSAPALSLGALSLAVSVGFASLLDPLWVRRWGALQAVAWLALVGGRFALGDPTLGPLQVGPAAGVPAALLLVLAYIVWRAAQVRDDALADAVRSRSEVVAVEAASVAKSAFLANMSHELRTPLTAVLGYAELVSDAIEDGDVDDASADLAKIRRAGTHLLDLVNDVLDLSKIEAGELTLERLDIDVSEVVAGVVQDVSSLAAERGNRVLASVPGAVQAVGDPLRLRQVLLNLVSNANKFTEDGEVLVRLVHHGDWLRLEVRDTGIGMSPEQLSRVFQPFQQADTSTTRRYGGTGLGLTICQHLVEAMGGTLSVDSTLGEGSSFTVELPRCVPVSEVPSTVPTSEAAAGT
jgi:signal transduction histidine kinase